MGSQKLSRTIPQYILHTSGEQITVLSLLHSVLFLRACLVTYFIKRITAFSALQETSPVRDRLCHAERGYRVSVQRFPQEQLRY
jgi:hypothetical protein